MLCACLEGCVERTLMLSSLLTAMLAAASGTLSWNTFLD